MQAGCILFYYTFHTVYATLTASLLYILTVLFSALHCTTRCSIYRTTPRLHCAHFCIRHCISAAWYTYSISYLLPLLPRLPSPYNAGHCWHWYVPVHTVISPTAWLVGSVPPECATTRHMENSWPHSSEICSNLAFPAAPLFLELDGGCLLLFAIL